MRCLALVLIAGSWALAQPPRPESFDTSGMPRRPTNFVEQQILDLLAAHTPGDFADAARIQRKIGRYYADKGDETRANKAFLAAAAAEDAERPNPLPPNQKVPVKDGSAPAGTAALTGNFFGFDGKTLHTWEFHADGTFLHTWMASGSGTSVRSSERGSFRIAGETLELKLISSATGFATPGVGGRTTAVGGAAESATQTRVVAFGLAEPEHAIVLEGIKLKPKSW